MKPATWLVCTTALFGLGFCLWPMTACGCFGPDPKIQVLSRMKLLNYGIEDYLADNDNVFPGVQDQKTFWKLVVAPTDQTIIRDPRDRDHQINIRFNTRLANVRLDDQFDQRQMMMLTSPYSKSRDTEPSHYLTTTVDGYFKVYPLDEWNAKYANFLDRNYPRVSETFLPATP